MADRALPRGADDGAVSRRRPAPTRADIAIAAALAALIQVEYHIDYANSGDVTLTHVIAGLAMTVPLAWRRTYPVVVGLGVVGFFCLQPEMVRPTPNTFTAAVCLVLAAAALALYPATWRAVAATGAAAVGLALLGSWLDPDPKGLEEVSMSLTVLGAWGAGALLRRQTERARASEAAVVTQRLAAVAAAEALVGAERGRIARELHDVVSHGLGVVVLQARGGRRMLGTDIDRARAAFDDIEKTATASLREMRLLLDVLRVESDVVQPSEPQPGLARLHDLLNRLRDAGQVVEVAVRGTPIPLSAGLDLSAYRIVQEALTNVARHAPGARSSLAIIYEPDRLILDIADDGPVVAEPAPGHGLVGMAERAQLYGGSLVWGPREPHGFLVRATLRCSAGTS